MSEWHRVGRTEDFPPGTGREVVAGEQLVAVFNVAGEFFALDGVCPHQGGPLGKGVLNGCVVTCPWHGWSFDVRTGQHQLNARLFHPGLEVKVEGEDILVRPRD